MPAIFMFIQFLPFVIIPIVIITIVVSALKHNKTTKDITNIFKNTISNANDPNSYGNSVSAENLDINCAYCGTRYARIKKKCPACGARDSSKK